MLCVSVLSLMKSLKSFEIRRGPCNMNTYEIN